MGYIFKNSRNSRRMIRLLYPSAALILKTHTYSKYPYTRTCSHTQFAHRQRSRWVMGKPCRAVTLNTNTLSNTVQSCQHPLAAREKSFCGTILLQYAIFDLSGSRDKLDTQYRCLNDPEDTYNAVTK